MNEPTRYAGYVVPELSHSRVEAQWSRISEQLPQPRARRRWSPALVMAVVAACALGGAYWNYNAPRVAESVWEGSLVASDESPVNVTLAEGTLIELDPHSEVSLMRSSAHAVQVSLSEGSARFDVAKKRNRRFSVQMGSVEVLVTGTQFRLVRSVVDGGERIRVIVEEGSVEVHRQGGTSVALDAGDQWSAFVADDEPSEQAATDDEPVQDEDELSQDDAADEDDARPHKSQRARRRQRARAESARAAELFEQANVLRRAGRVSEAAQLYDELAEKHARDRKAALAAFELGRIRMDSLSDMAGAADALDRALKLDSHRAFAEDALARLVIAHDSMGDKQACARARERYLSRYPEGVHASHLAARCGGN